MKAKLELKVLFKTLLAMLILTSCGEDSETNMDMQGETGVMVIHSALGVSDVKLFIDSNAINNSLNYGTNTPYLVSNVGRRNATVRLSSDSTVLIKQDIYLNPQKYYSFFVAGATASQNMSFVAVLDDLKKPSKERAKIRFLNMVADTLRVDLRTQFSTDTISKVSFSNAIFKTVSAFQEFKAGTYTFETIKTGQQDTVTKSQNFTFEDGKIYTIWLSGMIGGIGGNAIKANVLTNF